MQQFTDDQIIAAIDRAPKEVQEVIHSSKTHKLIASLASSHSLSSEALTRLAEVNRNMLTGLMTPDQAFSALTEVSVDQATAKSILTALHDNIFKTIQIPEPFIPTPQPPRVTSSPVRPALVPPPAPIQAPVSAPTPRVQPTTSTATVPEIRTMARDVSAIQHPSEAVAVTPAPAPVQPTIVPPQTLPTPASRPPVSPVPSRPPVSPGSSTPNIKDVSDTLKKYGIDPYREPLE